MLEFSQRTKKSFPRTLLSNCRREDIHLDDYTFNSTTNTTTYRVKLLTHKYYSQYLCWFMCVWLCVCLCAETCTKTKCIKPYTHLSSLAKVQTHTCRIVTMKFCIKYTQICSCVQYRVHYGNWGEPKEKAFWWILHLILFDMKIMN